MRIEIIGLLQNDPSSKGKNTSFRFVGGGPYLYAYGSLGDEILASLKAGDAVVASGNLNYGQDGDGNWNKYINLDGGLSVLKNMKQRDEESPTISFTAFGKINDITPQKTKKGQMAKFKLTETIVNWRGERELNHAMVSFSKTAEKILNSFSDGDTVIVMGEVKRLTNNNDEWYTSFNVTAIKEVEVMESFASESAGESEYGQVDEDDIPF